MRIVLTFNSGLIGGTGGAEKVCVTQANYFANKGWDTAIVTAEDPFSMNYYINKGLPFFKLDDKVRLINIWRPKWDNVTQFFTWNEIIAEMNPDVILTSGVDDVDLITRLGTPKAKIVNICHGRPDYDYDNVFDFHRSPEWVQRLKTLYYRVNGTNVFFESYKKYLPPDIKAKVKVIPNIVSLPTNQSQLKERNIVFLGRFDENKNQKAIINAFKKSKATEHCWELYLYGSENGYRNECEAMVTNDVNIHINDCERNIDRIYKNASIFVSASSYEGFPLSLTEAMSYGIPCIAKSTCSGSNELIKSGNNGLLYNNEDQLVDCINKLIDDEKLRRELGKSARESVSSYTEEYVMTLWEELIKEVLV